MLSIVSPLIPNLTILCPYRVTSSVLYLIRVASISLVLHDTELGILRERYIRQQSCSRSRVVLTLHSPSGLERRRQHGQGVEIERSLRGSFRRRLLLCLPRHLRQELQFHVSA